MALSDKNLIITPNIGSSNEPKIDFVGASTNTGPSTITATVYPTNNGTLSFDGTAGNLFSITNNLVSGSIFSVNPISGIPIIDVNADRTIALNPYGGNTGIGTTNPTAKLQVTGNVLISGITTVFSSGANGINLGVDGSNSTLSSRLFFSTGTVGQSFTLNNNNGSIVLASGGTPNVTSGTERLRVISSGSIGIGTTNPIQPIQIGTGSSVVVIDALGEVGIGTTNPTVKLQVIGDASISGIATIGLGTTSSPTINSTMSFELTNDTTLTVRVRGTDGVIRTGTIALA